VSPLGDAGQRAFLALELLAHYEAEAAHRMRTGKRVEVLTEVIANLVEASLVWDDHQHRELATHIRDLGGHEPLALGAVVAELELSQVLLLGGRSVDSGEGVCDSAVTAKVELPAGLK